MKMKRRLVTLALFLLLGAVLNITVAWGCALWSGANPEVSIGSPVPRQVREIHESHLPSELQKWDEARTASLDFGYDVYMVRSLETAEHHVETTAILVGWPGPALAAYHTYYYRKGDADAELESIMQEWESGILLVAGDNRWIPSHPIWPDFAINTIFYAAILWLLVCGPFALRRHIRHKRGL